MELAPEVAKAAAEVLRPPEDLAPSEFAARYRYLKQGTTFSPGRWSNEVFPYLVSIMDAINADERDIVAACLGVPAMLSGLKDEQRDLLVTAARKKFCPEEEAELEALDSDIERVEGMHDRFLKDMQKTISAWQSDEQEIINKLGSAA